MFTKTILKDDGIFVHEDFWAAKAAMRIAELNPTNPYMRIRRESSKVDSEAVLVSKAWWDNRVDAYETAVAATFSANLEIVADDHLGRNIHTMIDLIRGKVQTPALAKRVAAEGITLKNYKAYAIVDSKAYYADDSDAVVLEASTKKKGNIKAYLLHPDHYTALSAAPVAGSYTGTGDGTMDAQLHQGAAVAETITVTASAATTFTVTGSVTGAMGVATVGTLFDSPQLSILLVAGTIAFVAADEFVFSSVAA